MTFANLLNQLKSHDPTLPLVFQSQEGDIGAGYHVTELRQNSSVGIDCGGTIERWEDARLQLLDGQGGRHMSVGKFSKILEVSLQRMPELADLPLQVEYAPKNLGLRLMSLGDPVAGDEAVVVALGDQAAQCKPAARVTPAEGGCYSANAKTASCC